MKKTFLLALVLFTTGTFAQEKMLTKNGRVIFEATVPAFEEVKGKNESATCVLNPSTGEIASLALIKGFRFKIALMEEHFNENYMESDKYPKATFRGKIEGFNVANLTSTAKDYNIKGKLELHGKSKEITVPAKIRRTEAGIEIVSDFKVSVNDFNIRIPSVVQNKVSKNVSVHTEFTVK